MNNEIVVSNTESTKEFSKFESMLSTITNADDVVEAINNVKALEKLLKAADMFNQKAREYAMLEAKTYQRIYELGLVDDIPSKNYQRVIAVWFSELHDNERDEVIRLCGDSGQTIGAIWRKHVKEPEMTERAISNMRERGEDAIDDFKENGYVNIDDSLSRYSENKRIAPDVFNGYKDTIRNRLRKLGGHSVDSMPGVYVSTEYACKHFIDIKAAKVESINNDFNRLLKTIDEMRDSDFDFDLTIETKSNFTYELTDKSVINIAVCLLDGAKPSFKTESKRVEASIVATLITHLGWSIARIVKEILIDGAVFRTSAEQKCIDLLGFTDDEIAILISAYEKLYPCDTSKRMLDQFIRGY